MSDLDRLKQILLAEEREKLRRAELRIAELEQKNSELSALLPSLVRAAPHEPMTRALASPVAAALGSAVRDNRSEHRRRPVPGHRSDHPQGHRRGTARAHERSQQGPRIRFQSTRRALAHRGLAQRRAVRPDRASPHTALRHRSCVPDRARFGTGSASPVLARAARSRCRRDRRHADRDRRVRAAIRSAATAAIRSKRPALAITCCGCSTDRARRSPASSPACRPNSLRAVLSDRLEQIHAQLADSAETEAAETRQNLASGWDAALNPAAIVAASAELSDQGEQTSTRTSRWPLIGVLLLVLGALAWYFARIERWNARVEALAHGAGHPSRVSCSAKSTPSRGSRWPSTDCSMPMPKPIQPLLERVDLGDVEPELAAGRLSVDGGCGAAASRAGACSVRPRASADRAGGRA